MFRYINMPKLVATYLHEFNTNTSGVVSNLYKFIFCLCLPFVSTTFRRARLNALAIAECTVSADQISRVLNKLTGAEILSMVGGEDYMVAYEYESGSESNFCYTTNAEGVPYRDPANSVYMTIRLNDAERDDVDSYLSLLVPFYVQTIITYIS